MTLTDYLAKNYLSAEGKPSKKKRKKKAQGLTIDEDPSDWPTSTQEADEEFGDGAPTVVGSVLTGGLNVPRKQATWTTIGVQAPTDAEQVEADAILAQAQEEDRARARDDDEAPAVVDDDGPMMASGAMAGLQTADQVSAALKRREKAEKKAMKEAGLDSSGLAQETIYRDASGRVVNIAMKRAELRAKEDDKQRREAEELENRKGDVQRLEKEERRQALQEAKGMSVARYADDEKMNNELKERERWNDPMSQLLASKNVKTDTKPGRTKGGRATYQGAFEPNRYGIRPGWRWDGVDRSNGFERKWFAARNKAKDRQELEYSWQMDE